MCVVSVLMPHHEDATQVQYVSLAEARGSCRRFASWDLTF